MTNKIFIALLAYGVTGIFLVAAAKMANMTPDQLGVTVTFAMLMHLNNYFLGSALMDRDHEKKWERRVLKRDI